MSRIIESVNGNIKADFVLSSEVDVAQWFPLPQALEQLREGGIAWQLVKTIVDKNKTECST